MVSRSRTVQRSRSVPMIEARARVDSWLGARTRSMSNFQLMNKPIHIQTRSKIDTWNQLRRTRREKSVDRSRISNRPEGKAKIDTWQERDMMIRREWNKKLDQPIHIQARSKIDTWSSTATASKTISRRQKVVNRITFILFHRFIF